MDDLLAQCTGKKYKLAKVPILVAPPPKPNTGTGIAYVSGYLLKKCFTKHQCEICKAVQVSYEIDYNWKLLCFFKAYETGEVDPFGGVNAPTIPYMEYVTQLENVCSQTFPSSGDVFANIF